MKKPGRAIIVILLLSSFSAAQINNDRKLSKVPRGLREGLVERVNRYFQYRQAKDYKRLYDLISIGSMIGTPKPSLNDFVSRERQRDEGFTITKWRLEYLQKDSDDKNGPIYLLGIKVTTSSKGRTVEGDAQLDARIEGGEWHFREYRIGSW
jgi:hypothetical protein